MEENKWGSAQSSINNHNYQSVIVDVIFEIQNPMDVTRKSMSKWMVDGVVDLVNVSAPKVPFEITAFKKANIRYNRCIFMARRASWSKLFCKQKVPIEITAITYEHVLPNV